MIKFLSEAKKYRKLILEFTITIAITSNNMPTVRNC